MQGLFAVFALGMKCKPHLQVFSLDLAWDLFSILVLCGSARDFLLLPGRAWCLSCCGF